MPSVIHLGELQTEGRNSKSNDIDQVSTTELCRIINDEDATIAEAVEKCVPNIAAAIDSLEKRGRQGGRIVYVGAGTSGRLGVLDASEIPPTYSASNEQFVALIAGGDVALRYAQEGAEDDVVAAENDLKALKLDGEVDSLIGIAASGRTPHVLRCLSFAKSLGCITIGVACCDPSAMSKEGTVDHMISVVTGPEVVTGSTRMKAGTATKLVLNMLSTGVMIKLGKTYGNMMIDVKATNEKLQERSRDIIRTICGSSFPSSNDDLDLLLRECGGSVKIAVASILLRVSVDESQRRLADTRGILAEVLKGCQKGEHMEESRNCKGSHRFVLCVDGGGSKCHAVLLGENGEIGRGEAGECNVTSVGVNAAMASIQTAVRQAVDSCPTILGTPFQSINFAKIWIGLAGYDRANIASLVDSSLSKLFYVPISTRLKVTSDVDLLVTAIGSKSPLNSVVILLAGTGSIAMSFERNSDGFNRTGRVGGWGSLLGDDGSGYSIGRQGLRIALDTTEKFNLRQESVEDVKNEDPMVEKILEHFDLLGNQDIRTDLLSRVVSPEHSEQGSTPTKRIAGVARVVLDAVPCSLTAKSIVETGIESLLHILASLVKSQKKESLNSALVLAGGLMHNETYQRLLLNSLASSGFHFGNIEIVKDPAMIAARYLLEEVRITS